MLRCVDSDASVTSTRPNVSATHHRGAALHGAARRETRPVGHARDRAVSGTQLMFALYLSVILVEYGGLAKLLPVLQVIKFSTLASYGLFVWVLARVGVSPLLRFTQSKLLIAFISFTILSVLWAIVQLYAVQAIRPLVEYAMLFLVTAVLVDRQSRVDALSWLLLGVSAMLVVRNFDKLTSGVRSGSFDAPYFMGDGNDFAWCMVILLPFVANLLLGDRRLLTRLVALGGVGVCLLGIVGTGSRGGAVGLGASLLFYWLVMSRNKALGAAALAAIVAGILIFAPSHFTERMGTIAEYREDNSAQGRLQAWKTSIRMAVDWPLGVGAGNFSSAYGRLYMPADSRNALTWGAHRWISAHSVYFKVLGEYGIIGLLIFLGIIVRNLRDNIAMRRALLADPGTAKFSATWPGLLNMALIGFAVCGAFLSGVSQPHLFFLSGLTVAMIHHSALGQHQAVKRAPGRTKA
jgi:probable O-glycosylation ligase (exosortase A-associated)